MNRRGAGCFVFSELNLPESVGSSTRHPARQITAEECAPNCKEEKVAHNRPLLRRVSVPFSNRPVVDNFQEVHAYASRCSDTNSNPQFWRTRLKTKEPDSNCLEPGIYLATTYSHRTYRPTTIGAAAFHFRVRNGTGWFHRALATRGQPRLYRGWVSSGQNC